MSPEIVLAKVKNIKFNLLLIPVLLVLVSFHSGPGKDKSAGIKTIVIDAGHGGKDPGCNGVFAKEKDVSLAVALKLGKLIEDNLKDVKVIYTRKTDEFVELEERAMIANRAKADLFISIHCNAAGKVVTYKDKKTGKTKVKMRKNKKGKLVPVETTNPVPYGSETYVMGIKNEQGKMKVASRENSVIYMEDDYEKKYEGFDPDSEESYIIMSNYTTAYVIQSANLAVKIQDEYAQKAGRYDKGVHRQSIWVLWRTAMPSILTEIGFLTNPLEEKFLASDEGQTYLARALFRALRKYKDEVEGNKKEYNDEIEKEKPIENENFKAGNLPGQKPNQTDDDDDDETVDENDVKADEAKNNGNSDSSKTVKDEMKLQDDNKGMIADTLKVVEPEKTDVKSIADKFKQQKSEEVVFRVQFASSNVELSLKEEKYKPIESAWYYKSGDVLKYTSGKFKTMSEAANHQALLRKSGFTDCFVVAFKNDQRIDINEARKLSGN